MGITVWKQETRWGGDSWNSCVESIYIEVFHTGTDKISYMEIPADTKVTLSEKLYKSLQAYSLMLCAMASALSIVREYTPVSSYSFSMPLITASATILPNLPHPTIANFFIL